MARTTKTAATNTPTPVKVDAIDRLIAKLNTIDGIEFAKDAWVNKAPENYGVVTLNGEPAQLWADGHLLDSVWSVIIHLYVVGDDNSWPALIQAKLELMESDNEVELTHTNSREFDYETGKVHWMWQVRLMGPLTWEES